MTTTDFKKKVIIWIKAKKKEVYDPDNEGITEEEALEAGFLDGVQQTEIRVLDEMIDYLDEMIDYLEQL